MHKEAQRESTGWIEQTSADYLIRNSCILSLETPLISQLSTINSQVPLARLTYTGGDAPPGTTPLAGQTALPPDLEQAAVEQIA
jgi:hypothetical protein